MKSIAWPSASHTSLFPFLSRTTSRHRFHNMRLLEQKTDAQRTMASPSPNPPQFTLFPKLSPELQLEIWTHAASVPRLVAVRSLLFGAQPRVFGFLQDLVNYKNGWRWTQVGSKSRRLVVNYQVPPILHACYDSRQVGLKFYKTYFKEQLGVPIYFSTNADTLYFVNYSALVIFLQRQSNMLNAIMGVRMDGIDKSLHPDVAGVHSLVIDIKDWQNLLYSNHFIELDTLTVVYGHRDFIEDNDEEKVSEIVDFLTSGWGGDIWEQTQPATLQFISRKSFRSLILATRSRTQSSETRRGNRGRVEIACEMCSTKKLTREGLEVFSPLIVHSFTVNLESFFKWPRIYDKAANFCLHAKLTSET
jgi:hypothetical protein